MVDPYEADLDEYNSFSPWTVSCTSAQLAQRLQSYGRGEGSSIDRLELTYSSLGNVIKVVVWWNNGLGFQGLQGPLPAHLIADDAVDIVLQLHHIDHREVAPGAPVVLEAPPAFKA